ncbi:MAG: hypothetical protein ACFNYD_01785 [Bacteroides sp.]
MGMECRPDSDSARRAATPFGEREHTLKANETHKGRLPPAGGRVLAARDIGRTPPVGGQLACCPYRASPTKIHIE